MKLQSVQSNEQFVHLVQTQKSNQSFESSAFRMNWAGLDSVKVQTITPVYSVTQESVSSSYIDCPTLMIDPSGVHHTLN